MATTLKASGAGFRHLRAYVLATNGLGDVPAALAADTAYPGLWANTAKALTLTIPDVQIIQHTGDDVVSQVDLLPPTEAASAEMRTGVTNLELDAALSNVLGFTLGDMQAMGRGTDQQGLEPDVCILAYRQSVDADPASTTKGARRWNWVIIPKGIVFPRSGPMEEGGMDENVYTVQPRVANQFPWGTALTLVTHGCTEIQFISGISDFRPMIDYWRGDAAETVFDLTYNAQATTKMKVWHYVASTGVTTDVTATVTLAVGTITFGVAPAANDIITCFYEREN